MKKNGLLLVRLLALLTGCASGEGVVLKTVGCFAGADTSASAYVEILKAYETETGNRVEDTSAASDEAWKVSVLYDFAAGNEPDVLFFFAANANSAPILSRVVPIAEINAAYPDLHLTQNQLLAEADGMVYAIPARPFWEGLFVNTDLFEQHGLDLPTDWAKLETAIQTFRQEGIVPIAVSLSNIPHYIAEFAILASGSPREYTQRPTSLAQVPASWYQGMEMIHHLYEIGAFAEDVNANTEAVSSQLFREKKAAMQLVCQQHPDGKHGYNPCDALSHMCGGSRQHGDYRRRVHGLLPDAQSMERSQQARCSRAAVGLPDQWRKRGKNRRRSLFRQAAGIGKCNAPKCRRYG